MISVLDQLNAVLNSLEEMSMSNSSDTATKAAGLLKLFRNGVTIPGLNRL